MENPNSHSVASAMEAVAQWRSEVDTEGQTKLAKISEEITKLEQSIADLQAQVEGLTTKRSEQEEATAAALAEEGNRIYQGMFDSLSYQKARVGERAAHMLAAETTKHAVLLDTLQNDAEIGPIYKELVQFKETVEPTLAALPETYQKTIRSHHDEQATKVRAWLEANDGEPVVFAGDELHVDVVFGVDAPEGQAEIVMIVLPVDESVYQEWHARPQDVQTMLAARSVQAVYEACRAMDYRSAQAMFGGHMGLLAIEVELPGGEPASFQIAFKAAFDRILAAAPELKNAKVVARGHHALVDHMLPPEPEEEAESEEEQEDA